MLDKVEALYKARLHMEAALQLTQQALGGTDSGRVRSTYIKELIAEIDTDIQDLLSTIQI